MKKGSSSKALNHSATISIVEFWQKLSAITSLQKLGTKILIGNIEANGRFWTALMVWLERRFAAKFYRYSNTDQVIVESHRHQVSWLEENSESWLAHYQYCQDSQVGVSLGASFLQDGIPLWIGYAQTPPVLPVWQEFDYYLDLAEPIKNWEAILPCLQELLGGAGAKLNAEKLRVWSTLAKSNLDEGLTWLQHLELLTAANIEVWAKSLESLGQPLQKQLYAMSDALWMQKERDFWSLWFALKPHYPTPFWLAFWQNRLWQGICYWLSQDAGLPVDGPAWKSGLPSNLQQPGRRSAKLLQKAIDAYCKLGNLDADLRSGNGSASLEPIWLEFYNLS